MKVKQLIEKLKTYSENEDVCILIYNYGEFDFEALEESNIGTEKDHWVCDDVLILIGKDE